MYYVGMGRITLVMPHFTSCMVIYTVLQCVCVKWPFKYALRLLKSTTAIKLYHMDLEVTDYNILKMDNHYNSAIILQTIKDGYIHATSE